MDLLIVNLVTLEQTFIDYYNFDSLLRDALRLQSRPADVDVTKLELKNDNIQMNSKAFNYSARLRRQKRQKNDYLVEWSDETIYAVFANKLQQNPTSIVMGVRYDSHTFEEYHLLIAKFRDQVLTVDSLTPVNQAYLSSK